MQFQTYVSGLKEKKAPLIILIFLVLVNIAFSQSLDNFQIRGRILDESNAVVAYANVALYIKPENTLVGGQMTNEKGDFLFINLKKGCYYVKISFIGYEELTRDSIILNPNNPVKSLGNMILQTKSSILNEVNVIGDRLKGEEMVDRTVYNINQAIVKSSNNGMDVLKRIPSIQIDAENNITLEGSGNILIYVDGKESNREYVYSINPELIDKIEVINNPSSKYDASITGVISIILKHQSTNGGVLNISTEVPLSRTYNSDHSINLTFGYKKFTLDLNTFLYLSNWKDERNILRESFMPDTARMFQYGMEWPGYKAIQPSLTLGYFFNKKNLLYIDFRKAYNGFYKEQDMRRRENIIFQGSDTIKDFYTDKRFDWDYNSNVYSAFYKKMFTKPETELNVYVSYITWRDKGYDYNLDSMNTGFFISEQRRFTTKNHEDVFFGKLDFSTALSKNLKFESGYAFSDQKLSNDLTGTTKTFEDILIPAFDSLKYDETRNAAYVSFSGNINKFSWMAGLRLENSGILINKKTPADYTCLLPNISLQHKLKDRNSVKLSYRRRIIRPQSFHLNPFLKQNEKMTYEQGDPNIKPSYVNSFKFSFNLSLGKSMVIPQLFFNYNERNINRIMSLSSENILTKSYKNGGNSYEYGAELSAQLQVFKWWALNPYFRIGKAHINGLKNNLFSIKEQTDLLWTVNLSSVMTLYKNLNIIMDFNGRSPFISPQTLTYRDAYYSLRIEKSIFKEKAKVGIDVFTPFQTRFVAGRIVTEAHDAYQNFKQTDKNILVYNYRILAVFTYNLKWGQMENKTTLNRNDINEGRGGGF